MTSYFSASKGLGYGWITSAPDEDAAILLESLLETPARWPELVASETGPFVDRIRTAATQMGSVYRELSDRPERDVAEIADMAPTFLFMAGYMKKIPKAIVAKQACLNLHPAVPFGPIGRWQDVIWSLIAMKASRIGAMIHVATNEMDRGPIISFVETDIDPSLAPLWTELEGKVNRAGGLAAVVAEEHENEPLFRAIRQQQFALEVPLIHATLDLIGNPDVRVSLEGITTSGVVRKAGISLTAEAQRLASEASPVLSTEE